MRKIPAPARHAGGHAGCRAVERRARIVHCPATHAREVAGRGVPPSAGRGRSRSQDTVCGAGDEPTGTAEIMTGTGDQVVGAEPVIRGEVLDVYELVPADDQVTESVAGIVSRRNPAA